MTTGRSEARGQVLLLAAAPRRSRRRLLDPEYGVNALGAVPTRTLLPDWAGPVDLVQLVDPGEPQAVLSRLQNAAAVEGPLLVYLCGQLTRDRRQHQIHLALAETAESTIRYTALPWSWISRTLSPRRPGTTTVVMDLLCAPSCLPMTADDLTLPPHVAQWGVVAPPAERVPSRVPAYTASLAELLRRALPMQHIIRLHPLACAQAQLVPGTVVIGPTATQGEAAHVPHLRPVPTAPAPAPMPPTAPLPPPVPPVAAAAPPVDIGHTVPDLRPAIARAMRAGHHHSAAELTAQWERAVLRALGRESMAMGDVLEVQATAAAEAGTTARAAERWTATAEHRIQWHHPSHQTVQLAARNALACWRQLDNDEPELATVGIRLADLLRSAGRASGAAAIEAALANLQSPSGPSLINGRIGRV